MSVVHDNLRADGDVPGPPGPPAAGPAPGREDRPEPPDQAQGAATGGLLQEAGLRKSLDNARRRTGRTAAVVAQEETRRRDVRRTAQLLKEGIAQLEAENRELRAKLGQAERELAEERRFSEETSRQLRELQG